MRVLNMPCPLEMGRIVSKECKELNCPFFEENKCNDKKAKIYELKEAKE